MSNMSKIVNIRDREGQRCHVIKIMKIRNLNFMYQFYDQVTINPSGWVMGICTSHTNIVDFMSI